MAMQLDKKIMNSLKYLEKYRLVSDEAIVSYSGGKDSKVILDLCCKVFKKVHPFFQYFIDGLSVIDNEIAADEARWGVKVERYPGFGLYGAIENGTYCDVSSGDVNVLMPYVPSNIGCACHVLYTSFCNHTLIG
jgi:phosphoadenosine phosphosulfate reductase